MRPFRVEDVPAVLAYASDTEVTRLPLLAGIAVVAARAIVWAAESMAASIRQKVIERVAQKVIDNWDRAGAELRRRPRDSAGLYQQGCRGDGAGGD